jgi:uncharacterized repeat protein (TIGR03943 family)
MEDIVLKRFKFIQNLTDWVVNPTLPEHTEANTPTETAFWDQAESAGEEADPLKRNILQWRRLISSVREPLDIFPGQPVDLIGFVHRTPQDATDHFTLARQVIRCCLADTVPLGLTVTSSEAQQFESHAWLHIQGVFTVAMNGNRRILAIAPQQIEQISPPRKIYINGVF